MIPGILFFGSLLRNPQRNFNFKNLLKSFKALIIVHQCLPTRISTKKKTHQKQTPRRYYTNILKVRVCKTKYGP